MPLEPMSHDEDVEVEWDGVPDSSIVPAGAHELVVKEVGVGWTATNKLAVEVQYEVAAGEASGSVMRPEMFVLGNDGDPRGLQPETRRKVFGWQNLKKLCNAVGVRYEQSLKMTVEQLSGRHFTGVVAVQVQAEKNRDGSPNQYAGQEQNRVTAYYPLGQAPATPQAVRGNGQSQPPSSQAPQPQRRMSAAEALAAASASQSPVSEEDLPF